MKRELVEAWSARIDRYPVFVVLANLAETKRRNDQLGHAEVDAEIATFDRLLGERGVVHARVGGDEWLLATHEDPAPLVATIVAAYARVDARCVGWRCVATRGSGSDGGDGDGEGEMREACETLVANVRRAVRFLGTPVNDPDGALQAARWLADEIAGLPLDSYLDFHASKTLPRRGWDCVDAYPRACYCPWCKGESFTWSDGGTGVYDASGSCTSCQAPVDFRDAGGPAVP